MFYISHRLLYYEIFRNKFLILYICNKLVYICDIYKQSSCSILLINHSTYEIFFEKVYFLYISHQLLKSRVSNLVHNAFRKKDGSLRYTHIKVTRAKGYSTHDINGGGDSMYTADNICKMIEFLIDNIFVQFGGRLFPQVIGIPMGTNCAPLLADLFLHSYENEFRQYDQKWPQETCQVI